MNNFSVQSIEEFSIKPQISKISSIEGHKFDNNVSYLLCPKEKILPYFSFIKQKMFSCIFGAVTKGIFHQNLIAIKSIDHEDHYFKAKKNKQ